MDRGLYVLLYDEDCHICSMAARLVAALDIRKRLRVRPILSARDLLRTVPEERILDSFHIVSPEGGLTSGADAVPVLIGAFPMGPGASRLLRESRTLMDVTRRSYAFVARFRDALTCRVRGAPSGWASGGR